ncbi:SDR family NAD(P)-dependent oxidoreductase [Umezawaea beigongshangensis]|uniref:SDR family NAD(P)-dependent oxidoreductase n=1 Tax=Umezawaea beigongshangensis TaxID=2780383 RepID=UPI0018F128D8|nr:glucose 1-dehydrogenase [Umezawaea beigongshangensis]
MNAEFAGKVVLVTGGGSGIGRAVALAFARAGAAVVVAGRGEDGLAATVEQIEAGGGTGSFVVADVSVAAEVSAAVDAAVSRYGGLHVAVNNAGVLGRPGPVADLDEEVWASVIGTNLTGTWLSMKYEIAHMREHGGGVVVNVASNIGFHGRRPGLAAYASSKAAVSVLTRAAARDHIGDGVRINSVSPGATGTSMSRAPGETDAERDERLALHVPLGRIGTTEEVADAVLWLASDSSSFTVGHDLVLDGGATA